MRPADLQKAVDRARRRVARLTDEAREELDAKARTTIAKARARSLRVSGR